MLKNDPHVFQGMQRDWAISKQPSEFLYEAHNIRFTARQGDTKLSITNERGPATLSPTIVGTYIGHCVLKPYIIVFTHSYDTTNGNVDRICRIEINSVTGGINTLFYLFTGDLGFRITNPISTLGYYEAENIQKVYWIDGINQPRFINIKDPELKIGGVITQEAIDAANLYTNTSFDFVKTLQLNESINVERVEGGGIFPAGIIQYCITYSNLYGAESNISEVTPLIPISFRDRGGSPEESISIGFKIIIDNIDTNNFEYLHLYSILRTSIDAAPQTRLVDKIYIKDLQSSDSVIIIDNGQKGSNIDPNMLLYIGGEDVRPNCFYQYDNTLFLGNFEEKRRSISQIVDISNLALKPTTNPVNPEPTDIQYYTSPGDVNPYNFCGSIVNTNYNNNEGSVAFKTARNVALPNESNTQAFNNLTYLSTLLGTKIVNDTATKYSTPSNYFRGDEYYRLGIQFQYKTGTWSEPIWIGDVKTAAVHPILFEKDIIEISPSKTTHLSYETLNEISVRLPKNTVELIYNEGYYKIRPVAVFPSLSDTNILCQGIVTPTVYNKSLRAIGTPYSQSSWFVRPFPGNKLNNLLRPIDDEITRSYDPDATNSPTAGPTPSPAESLFVENFSANIESSNHSDLFRVQSGYHFDKYIDTLGSNSNLKEPIEIYNKRIEANQYDNNTTTLEAGGVDAFDNSTPENVSKGAAVQFEHNKGLYSCWDFGGEIDGAAPLVEVTRVENDTPITEYYIFNKKVGSEQLYSWYYVDQNILSLYSPDLLFDDQYTLMDYNPDNYYFKITGKACYNINLGDIKINTSSSTVTSKGSGATKLKVNATDKYSERILSSGFFYGDCLLDTNNSELAFPYKYGTNGDVHRGVEDYGGDEVLYMVYPWQKSGSLNNDANRPNGSTRTAVLKEKCISNIKYSTQSLFYSNIGWSDPYAPSKSRFNLTGLSLFKSDIMSLSKLQTGSSYYGNVDTVIPTVLNLGKIFTMGSYSGFSADSDLGIPVSPSYKDTPTSKTIIQGIEYASSSNSVKDTWYKIPASTPSPQSTIAPTATPSPTNNGAPGDVASSLRVNKESIRMRYKSAPHFICNLPQDIYLKKEESLFGTGTLPTTFKDALFSSYSYSYIVELTKKTTDTASLFGGTSDESLQNNTWIVAGDAVRLTSDMFKDLDPDPIEISYSYGDTWFQRYDCLRTYPFTFEDENQIIDIASFMVETKINIDGRYDKNRLAASNFNLSPANFNLLNTVYSQRDNFFQYRILPELYYNNRTLPSTFSWTLDKNPGDEIDKWTNVTLANTHLLDGTYGPINAIVGYRDKLFAFQDSAIQNIIFNPRVQIPVSDGVPIEISNSGKLEGAKLVSSNMGCVNKWEIAESNSGIYFRDSISKELMHIGDGITNISGVKGFSFWFKDQSTAQWSLWRWHQNAGANRLFIDNTYNDLYFVTKDDSLVFSETLGAFSSFMSYKKLVGLFNIEKYAYCMTSSNETYTTTLHKMFAGEQNKFFGEYKPFSLTFISNAESPKDKIFTILDTRVDFYNVSNSYTPTPTLNPTPTPVPTIQPTSSIPNRDNPVESSDTDPGYMADKLNTINGLTLETTKFFDYIQVQTEYQNSGVVNLNLKNCKLLNYNTFNSIKQGNLSKKFRTWRVTLPRDASSKFGRDRIRNNWCKVTLGMREPTENTNTLYNTRMELHDLIVQYDA